MKVKYILIFLALGILGFVLLARSASASIINPKRIIIENPPNPPNPPTKPEPSDPPKPPCGDPGCLTQTPTPTPTATSTPTPTPTSGQPGTGGAPFQFGGPPPPPPVGGKVLGLSATAGEDNGLAALFILGAICLSLGLRSRRSFFASKR